MNKEKILNQTLKEKFGYLRECPYIGDYVLRIGDSGEKSTLTKEKVLFSGYGFYSKPIKRVSVFYIRTLIKEYTFVGGEWQNNRDLEFIINH